MNKQLLTIGFLASSILSFGQEIKREVIDKELGTLKIIVLEDNSNLPENEAIQFLNNTLKTEPNTTFVNEKTQKLDDNRSLLRLKETVDGIEVFNSYYNVHLENGFVKKYNGKFINNITIQKESLSKENALDKALNYFNADEYYWENDFEENLIKKIKNDDNATHYPNPKLTYYDFNKEISLCYVMDIYASKPYRAEKVFVDASNGKIINTIQLIHDANKEAVGISKFSDTVSFNTFETSPGVYTLNDTTRGGGVETYNMNESTDYADATEFTHEDTIWDITNANKDEVAIDAHWGASVTYDYFLEKHGRDSYDGNGSTLMSFVHYDVNWSNASWNGFNMRYGDGSPGGNPYLGLDIVGHEIAHGVTGNSAGLIYQGESGALNESFSDIFGNAIEYYSDSNRAEWLVGEQCFNQLRNMANPNSFGDPDTYEGTSWANTSSTAFDNGGVHTNSGVQNFWYYLLVEGGTGINDNGDSYNVQAMGWEVASEIAYRNLNEFLGVSSDYMDARDFSYEIAADIFGDCSTEALNVIEAWYAVGVGNRLDAQVQPDFLLNYSFACQLPMTIEIKNLTTENASFLWDFGNGTTSNSENPSVVYSNEGTYDVSLFAEVDNQCFTVSNTTSKSLQVIELGDTKEANCIPIVTTGSDVIGTKSVSLSGLFYESGMLDNDYNDYTCKTNTSLHIDSTYEITVVTSQGSGQNVLAWIDFNNDGDFLDDEIIFESNGVYGEHKGLVNFNGKNPKMGGTPLRMRVISDISFNNDISSCNEIRFGQTEDYSVVFVDGNGEIVIDNINELLDHNTSIIPNPSSDFITINSRTDEKITSVKIVDMLGKEVIVTSKLKIDVSDLNSGVYNLITTTSNKVYTNRFLKK